MPYTKLPLDTPDIIGTLKERGLKDFFFILPVWNFADFIYICNYIEKWA